MTQQLSDDLQALLKQIDAANDAACKQLLDAGASEAHLIYTTGLVRAFYRDAAVIQHTGIVDPDLDALIAAICTIMGSVIHASSRGSKARATAVAQGLINEVAEALSELIEEGKYVDLSQSN